MSNWKERAKKFIKNAELAKAVKVMEDNGIETGISQNQAAIIEKDVTQQKFSEVTWGLLQKLEGTNEPLPDYMK